MARDDRECWECGVALVGLSVCSDERECAERAGHDSEGPYVYSWERGESRWTENRELDAADAEARTER